MKQPRPFRFGVNTFGAHTRDAWVTTARRVESLGYSTLLLGDHLIAPMGPVSALVAAADATTTLRLGSYMFANDFRNPVFMAQEAATIDLLSGGRFELGLGTGWLRSDYAQSGVAFDPPGVRVARMQEALQIVKGFWADKPFTYAGAYYSVNELNGRPKPVQTPHPPIMIGGGSRRILSFAAQEANIVGINIKTTREGQLDMSTATPEATDQKVQWIRDAAGDRMGAIELNMLMNITSISENRRLAVQNSARKWGMSLDDAGADQWLTSPVVLVGSVDQIVEGLQMRRERYGVSYIVINDDMIDAFAPVVERLAGT